MNLSETHLKYPKRLTNLIASQSSNHFTCASYKQEIMPPKPKRTISISTIISVSLLIIMGLAFILTIKHQLLGVIS